jgi:RNA polymerase sigma-70 factor (ECF subfamily)
VEPDSDAGLMRRLARGDEAAMVELVGRWERPVLGYVYRFLGCSGEDARDLAQEVFLRLWRRRRKWRPTAGFSTWLFTIAGNLCRNRKRDLGRRPTLVPVEDGADEREDPLSCAEAAQTARRVRGAVARLPDAQREVVLLRHFGGLSYREIAQISGTTPPAVDSMLVRARRTLAKRLCDNPQESEESGVER